MKKEDSIDGDDRIDFTCIVGKIYFDYPLREKRNKPFYKKSYTQLTNRRMHQNAIVGDSRVLDLAIENYDNLSMGG
ncbi:TPA: hypothetical protein TY426_001256 [Streptococcus suis]|nr:hypothetical protein [Streptococcus suis]